MAARIELTGRRYGRWTVLRRSPTRRRYWVCRCECGSTKEVFAGSLGDGQSRSCGCIFSEILRRRNTTHGLSKTAEYRVWAGIKKRCLQPSCKSYKHYGGRGIRICARWLHDFPVFLADVGHRPSTKHSIERLNNDGHYEPGNVCWSDQLTQANNKRTVKYIVVNGRRVRASAYAVEQDISAGAYRHRTSRGWTPERAALTPALKHRRFTFKGATHTIAGWAALLNIPHRTLRARFEEHGWSVERALTEPVRRTSRAGSHLSRV